MTRIPRHQYPSARDWLINQMFLSFIECKKFFWFESYFFHTVNVRTWIKVIYWTSIGERLVEKEHFISSISDSQNSSKKGISSSPNITRTYANIRQIKGSENTFPRRSRMSLIFIGSSKATVDKYFSHSCKIRTLEKKKRKRTTLLLTMTTAERNILLLSFCVFFSSTNRFLTWIARKSTNITIR